MNGYPQKFGQCWLTYWCMYIINDATMPTFHENVIDSMEGMKF